jgi:hypothetical protein
VERSELNIEHLIGMVDRASPDGDPLDRLTESIMLAGGLEELSNELIGHFVDEAREAGISWSEIGAVLGVTRQAAQKRFVAKAAKKGKKRGLFTRFAARAREVVTDAELHAREAGSDHVGTEHLVLSIADDPASVGARALVGVGATLGRIREQANAVIESNATGNRRGHIPFSAASKKALELALRECLRLHDDQLSTQHLLLGILRGGHSAGARLLADNGVTLAKIDAWLADNRISE